MLGGSGEHYGLCLATTVLTSGSSVVGAGSRCTLRGGAIFRGTGLRGRTYARCLTGGRACARGVTRGRTCDANGGPLTVGVPNTRGGT